MTESHSRFPRRPPRLERIFSGVEPFFFVTFNTYKRRSLLASPVVHESFRQFVENGMASGVGVGRYVIMPDHVHLFVRLPRESRTLGEWVKALKRTMGKTLSSNGHVSPFWQEGFFDHLMRSDESYSEKWEYVRMNPVRAGLCRNPEDWPYQGEIEPIRF